MTSRSMALSAAASVMLQSFHRKFLLQLREIAAALEPVDDRRVKMVLDVGAADLDTDGFELLHHVPGALDRRRRVTRHQSPEILVGRIDHRSILCLEALGDLLLGLLLVRQRQVGAGHVGPDEARERLRSEEHTSELQSRGHLVCRLLLEKKKHKQKLTNASSYKQQKE